MENHTGQPSWGCRGATRKTRTDGERTPLPGVEFQGELGAWEEAWRAMLGLAAQMDPRGTKPGQGIQQQPQSPQLGVASLASSPPTQPRGRPPRRGALQGAQWPLSPPGPGPVTVAEDGATR